MWGYLVLYHDGVHALVGRRYDLQLRFNLQKMPRNAAQMHVGYTVQVVLDTDTWPLSLDGLDTFCACLLVQGHTYNVLLMAPVLVCVCAPRSVCV